MMRHDEYPSLKHFLGRYFHQDFLDEFTTVKNAINAFVSEEPTKLINCVLNELQLIASDCNFQNSPEATLLDLGCYYNPHSECATPITWLAEVRHTILHLVSNRK
jgi:predicted metal-dependent peptidase